MGVRGDYPHVRFLLSAIFPNCGTGSAETGKWRTSGTHSGHQLGAPLYGTPYFVSEVPMLFVPAVSAGRSPRGLFFQGATLEPHPRLTSDSCSFRGPGAQAADTHLPPLLALQHTSCGPGAASACPCSVTTAHGHLGSTQHGTLCLKGALQPPWRAGVTHPFLQMQKLKLRERACTLCWHELRV